MISPAAGLQTASPVGGSVHLMQAQVTLAADRHTEGSVNKHLQPQQISGRTLYLLLSDHVADLMNASEVGFPGQHHHIGILRIELHCFGIGDVHLGADVYLHADRAGIQDHGNIGGNDCRNPGIQGCIQHLAHQSGLVVENFRVQGEIAFNAVFRCNGCDFAEVPKAEIGG